MASQAAVPAVVMAALHLLLLTVLVGMAALQLLLLTAQVVLVVVMVAVPPHLLTVPAVMVVEALQDHLRQVPQPQELLVLSTQRIRLPSQTPIGTVQQVDSYSFLEIEI